MSMSAPCLTVALMAAWLVLIRLVLSSVSVYRGMRTVMMVDVKVGMDNMQLDNDVQVD